MTVDGILSKFDEKTVALAFETRQFLLEQLNDILELPDNSASVIGYGYGTGYKDLICTLLLSKQGVKLGFTKGGGLPDPQKLLVGSGKVHRYVEIKSVQDLKNPALKKLLTEALKAYQERKK
jgi:uncharacterized protein DUF1801